MGNRTMKRTAAVFAALVMGATLSACGGDGDSNASGDDNDASYCDLIKDHLEAFQKFNFGSATGDSFEDFRNAVDDIQAKAPDDVKDQWSTLGDGLDEFAAIFDKAGLTVDDLAELSAGGTPSGVEPQDLVQLQQDLTTFAQSNEFQDSLESLPQAVDDECGLQLDETPTDTPTHGGAS
jgi:ABC-type glycerol-3-phosphate transport system substrate-binding protein